MPAQAEIEVEVQRSMQAVYPAIEIESSDGGMQTVDRLSAILVTESTGIVPNRAVIRMGGADYWVDGPVTLNAIDWGIKPRTRVRVYNGDVTYFLGTFVNRLDQGTDDTIIWNAEDDRHLLFNIYVRGALVWDYKAGFIKYIDRYSPRMNPNGQWNCVAVSAEGGTYYVFADTAEIGLGYESPEEVFSANATPGQITAWTPRRAALYFNMLANLDPNATLGLKGNKTKQWRTLRNSDHLLWKPESVTSISGKEASDRYDPLDRKLPDIDFRGQRLLGALTQVLDIAGTHNLRVDYTEANGGWVSEVVLVPRSITALHGEGTARKTIPMQRGGEAEDINTAYDFHLFEDWSKVVESVLVHGAPVRVETELSFSNPSASDYLSTGDTWKPAWTKAEEDAMLTGIDGEDSGGERYALYPSQPGTTELDSLADGDGGRPLAFARTAEAVSLLRQCFPLVFQAWIVDSQQVGMAGKMAGVNDEYADTNEFPYLHSPRPILQHQLQFFVRDLKGDNDPNNRLRIPFPVRVQVEDLNTAGTYYDVLYSKGISVDGRRFIWMESLAENANGTTSCIYKGDIIEDPLNVELRKFKVNVAMPMDHRVTGYAETATKDAGIASSYYKDLGGPPMTYIDSPEGYTEHHQIDSHPGPTEVFEDRLLPPGSEQEHAQAAAERKLAVSRFPVRTSSWKMIGIRPEYRAGDWIDRVRIINPNFDDPDYDINAPVEHVAYDFVNQVTVIGGLVSTLTANSPRWNQGEVSRVAGENLMNPETFGNLSAEQQDALGGMDLTQQMVSGLPQIAAAVHADKTVPNVNNRRLMRRG